MAQQKFALQEERRLMSAQELFEAYLLTSSNEEKKEILNSLNNKGYGDLETDSIKELYYTADISDWMKSQLLISLFDRQDDDALPLAKQFVSNAGRGTGEIWHWIYDYDRDYVLETASGMSIKQLVDSSIVQSFAYQDSDAMRKFLGNQLDNILAVENVGFFRGIFMLPIEIELSDRQQREIGELLFAERESVRAIAINFAININDLGLLRDAFNNFSSQQERDNLINSLTSTDRVSHRSLAQELLDQKQ